MVAEYPKDSLSHVRLFSRKDSFYTNDVLAYERFSKIYKAEMTCEKLQNAINREISLSSFIDTTFSIGGPISIYKIDSSNNVTILQNDFSKKPDGERVGHLLP